LSHSKLTVEIGVFALNSRDEEIQSPKAQSWLWTPTAIFRGSRETDPINESIGMA
jgi:hypothetical protein